VGEEGAVRGFEDSFARGSEEDGIIFIFAEANRSNPRRRKVTPKQTLDPTLKKAEA